MAPRLWRRDHQRAVQALRLVYVTEQRVRQTKVSTSLKQSTTRNGEHRLQKSSLIAVRVSHRLMTTQRCVEEERRKGGAWRAVQPSTRHNSCRIKQSPRMKLFSNVHYMSKFLCLFT